MTRRHERQLELFFTLSLDMLCIAGFDGYFKRLNPAWEKTLGFTLEELTAKPFIDFVHPDDRAATAAEAQKLMTGTDTVSFENRYACKDGSYKWLLWSATVSREEQTYYAVARNITGRKRAEEALNREHTLLRTLIDNVPDCIFIKDAQSRFIINNAAHIRVLRATAQVDLSGKTDFDIFPEALAAQYYADEQAVIQSGQPLINREEPVLDERGVSRWHQTTKVPWRDPQGRIIGIIGVSRDITEHKRAEEAIRRAKEEAEQANRSKSMFLSRMSHELRTPLNAIIGFSDLLLERVGGDLTAKQEEFLRDIRDSGMHLLTLINDVLDISKIEAGRMELYVTDADLPEVVESALTTVLPLVEQKHLDVSSTFDPGVTVVRADKVRLKQILCNLLSNAAKFTPEGGKIRVEAHRAGGEVEIAVVDTGPGIAPADQARLFQEFTQLQAVRGAPAGTGLGLALVRRLVDLHGGRVWVESQVGSGSRFVVRLPIGTAPEPAAARPGSVLVVDDDPTIRRLFTHYLSEAGYRTDATGNGPGVVDTVKAVRPAAICLDIRLPGLEDWEVLRRLKEDPATAFIPVVVTTILDDARRAFALGATHFLVKPIRREDLLDAVAKAMGAAPAAGRTVLIVDDDPSVLAAVAPMLEQAGYRTLQASGGREAIKQAVQHLPHLIVLDLLMPDLSGFDVIVALRADVRTCGIPVLVLTAKDLSADDRAFLAQRVQTIRLKQSTPPEALVEAVGRVLAPPGVSGR
jgi:PAS domain S-box-containing protein